MLQLFGPLNTGIATGGDGSAASNADSGSIAGTVVAVAIRPNFSYLSTTMDISIKTKGGSAPQITILEVTATDEAWYYPRLPIQDGAGADIADMYGLGIPVFDMLNVAIEAANDDDHADIWLLLDT